ncbi:MAG: polysaccharide deacetylase family protein [Verrucomicrobiota bacterium]
MISPTTPAQSPDLPRRRTATGMTLLLASVHAGLLLAGWHWGWPWAAGGLTAVWIGLTACTLYPHCRLFGSATRSFPCASRSVILTIDDGPSVDTEEVLALLAAHEVRAVFFLIGERAAQRPEDVRRIVAAGHLVGNHTQTHACYWYWSFPPWRQRRELRQCQHTLSAITGQIPSLFRAPAGLRNPYCNIIAAEFGLTVTGWRARGFDGVNNPLEKILATLRRGLCPGAIVLVHQGRPQAPEVLRRVLEMLAADGWSTTLPDAWLPPRQCAGAQPSGL